MKQEEKKINASLKLLVKTSIIVFIGVVLSKAFTYLYKVIIARQFGPEIYGIFSLATVILSFFITVSFLGLSEGLLRYVAIYRGKNQIKQIRYLIKVSMSILAVSSFLSMALLFILADFISVNLFHNAELSTFLKVFSLIIPISVASGIFLSLIKAYEKISAYSFIVNILQNVSRVLLLAIFIFIGLNSESIIWSYFLSVLLITIISYIVSKRYIPEAFGIVNLQKGRKTKVVSDLIGYSWPLIFLGVIGSLFFWIDSLIIGYFIDVANVGFYNAAFTIVSLFGIAPELFMQLFFPLITKEFAKNNTNLIKEISKQVNKWIFIMNLPLFVIIFLFPGAVINLLFGSEFTIADNTLRILSIGGFFSSLTLVLTNLLSMKGKSKVILINISLASLANLILNIFLVKKFGMLGAAISTSLVWIILGIILFIEVKKYLNFAPIRRKMIKISIISLFPILVLFFTKKLVPLTRFNVMLLGALFFLIYLTLILIFEGFDKHDRTVVEAVKNKLFAIKNSSIANFNILNRR
ncbi:flippase [Candidatus Pacearchaeota archaeon]|nr:flippase [Candidatus Pacearchaeota archaeon]